MERGSALRVTALLALGGLLVAATVPAVGTATVNPDASGTASENVTAAAGGDAAGDSTAATALEDSADPGQTADRHPSTDRDAADVGPADAPAPSAHGDQSRCELANVTLADPTPDSAAVNGSADDVAPLVGRLSRTFEERPGGGAGTAIGPGFLENRIGRETVPASSPTDAGSTADSDRRGEAATGPRTAFDAAGGRRASPGAVASGMPADGASGSSGGSDGAAPPGVGLAAALVGLLGAQVPAGGAVVVAERAGRTAATAVRTRSTAVRARATRLVDRRLPVPILGRYSRYDDSDPLENETRAAIVETVRESPGIYYAKLADATGVAEETVRYHGRILAEEGLVERREVRGRRRLYPTGEVDDARLSAALEEPAAADVLAAIERHEPATLSGLADALDRAPSTTSHHIDRLEADGLVIRERDGEALQVRLESSVRRELAPEAAAD